MITDHCFDTFYNSAFVINFNSVMSKAIRSKPDKSWPSTFRTFFDRMHTHVCGISFRSW